MKNLRTSHIVAIILAVFLVMVAIQAAFGQVVEDSAYVDPQVEQITGWLDIVLKVLGAVVLLLGSFATSKLPPKWRNEAEDAMLAAEAKLRGSLHMAAESGVAAGIKAGLTGPALILFALKHVVTSVPDAIVGLTPTPKEIMDNAPDIILRQLPAPIRGVLERIVTSYIPAGRDLGVPRVEGDDDLSAGLRDALR